MIVRSRNKHQILILITLPMILGMSACTKPQPAGLTDEGVILAATGILESINAGDYQRFTQDFSETMLSAIPEDQFIQLRNLIQQTSGGFVSIGNPTLLNQNGYAVYRFPCQFEKENVIVTVNFQIGGTKVEGLFFDSTNLRSANQ